MLQTLQTSDKLAQNTWLSLPRPLWLKIYEYFFLDFELINKIYFNLVCKLFDNVTRDPAFIKVLINRYCPYLTDSPDFEKNSQVFLPFLRRTLALNIPSTDHTFFVRNYCITKIILGTNPRTLLSKLKEQLPKIYNKRGNDRNLDIVSGSLEDKISFASLFQLFATQREFPVSAMSELHWIDLIMETTSLNNFRALVALFAPAYLPHQGLTGLKRAATFSNLRLLRELMQQKEAFFKKSVANGEPLDKTENPHKNETLLAVKHHLENDDVESIRVCLDTPSFDTEETKNLLNMPELCERIATWKFDDIFQEMTVRTFQTLQNLVGMGGFQDAMVVPLVKNNRADLLQLLKASTLPISNKLISDAFISAHKRLAEEMHHDPTSEASARCQNTMSAMQKNRFLFVALLRSPAILLWLLNLEATERPLSQSYLAKSQEELVQLHLNDPRTRYFYIQECLKYFEIYEYEDTHKQCFAELVKWACINNRLDVLKRLIEKSYGIFIKILVSATPKAFHHFLIAQIVHMQDVANSSQRENEPVIAKRIKYLAALLVKAANEDDSTTVDELLAPYLKAEQRRKSRSPGWIYSSEVEGPLIEAARLAVEMHDECVENQKVRVVLFQLAAIGDFSNEKVARLCEPLFLNIIEWATPSYLENFINYQCNIATKPYIYWFEFFKRVQKKNNPDLNEAVRTRLLYALCDEYSCYAMSKNNLSLVYALIVDDPILLEKIKDNPEWLLGSFRNFDLIVKIIWPRLSVQAKEKLLSIRPDNTDNTILSLFEELNTQYPQAALFKNWGEGVAYLLEPEVPDVVEKTAAPVLSAFPLRNSSEKLALSVELKPTDKREFDEIEESDKNAENDNPKKKSREL